MTVATRSLHLYKAVVWTIVAIVAIVVWTTTDLGFPAAEDFAGDMTLADMSYEANNSRTEGAPQQQVVNGWYVRDVLPVLAGQNSTIIDHQRLAMWQAQLLPRLLLIFGLGFCADRVGASLIMGRKPRPAGVITNAETGPAVPGNVNAAGDLRASQGPPEPFQADPSAPAAWTPPSQE